MSKQQKTTSHDLMFIFSIHPRQSISVGHIGGLGLIIMAMFTFYDNTSENCTHIFTGHRHFNI